ncbi:MAG: hypothetical protein L0H15_04535 [Nitrosospira sp.]|nr:hypothetical protein [Nitrosospira sp.]
MSTCYMCDQEATTMEHAPPKCIFPEKKDLSSYDDYRQGLITVPSCEEHNTTKSKDDEYLLYLLAASATSSVIGLNQFLTKVKRSAERKPGLMVMVASNAKPAQIFDFDKNLWEEGLGIYVDAPRIDTTLSKCARALYFHETQRKFSGAVKVITPFTQYIDSQFNATVSSALAQAEDFFAIHPSFGNNPDVFCYKFTEGENTAMMLLYFYTSTKILVQLDKR